MSEMQPVEASLLDKLKRIFNSIFEDIMKGFEEEGYEKEDEVDLDLNKSDHQPKDPEAKKLFTADNESKGKEYKYASKDNIYTVRVYANPNPEDKSKSIYFEITQKNKKSGKETPFKINKKYAKDEAQMKSELKDLFDYLDAKPTKSSNQIKVNLTKITADDHIDVALNKITANYDLVQVANDINDVLDSDEFIDSIPADQDTTYLITPENDDFDIQESEEDFNAESGYQLFFNMLVQLKVIVKQACWSPAIRDANIFELDQLENCADALIEKLGNKFAKYYNKSIMYPQIKNIQELDIDGDKDKILDYLVESIDDIVTSYQSVMYYDICQDDTNDYETYIQQIQYIRNQIYEKVYNKE